MSAPQIPAGQVELRRADRDLLLRLLAVDTVSPLETGVLSDGLWQAQRAYAAAAAEQGFVVARHEAPTAADLTGTGVPESVRRAAADPGFLACQPSLVLRLGPRRAAARTVMFNVHLDTVAGLEPVREEADRIHGRGAVDAKGPAVALLAGVRAALETEPRLTDRVTVLIQAVAGEEGGAMGVFGTRPLVRAGFTGRINLFCEPTGGRLLDHCTASMTACLSVDGEDAIDDRPGAGHNATVLLGYLAQHLAVALSAGTAGGQVCVAGMHTGDAHNRVYGSGRLLLNLSYGTPEAGRALAAATEQAVAEGLASFRTVFAGRPGFARTATDAAAVTRLEWLKRDLPALTPSADPVARALLEEHAGLPRWPADEPGFTCDAIWMQGVPGAHTAVFGPGDLAANRAHAAGEYVDVADLERYAAAIGRVLVQFSRTES
ncbi:hypothetical protein GCM10010112_67500 [Actinoplanes lobatus]|uniref:Acetylornithine deacetylase/succinyl-diaminopimelate desuccinylase-like protein n=1 Tax=Actinoplanes lobatus TaxID=113568 RepID=A0A7W7HI26_9ACTN|nr:M20/M25/M40 family metallo-hydrolase [Actinoplanes lobatus]MBB4750921.1 acetylornithine deacetylase/succinyl-diaminopimelate desuccinylase-like protein [Actinoplanes lobatus]GGN86219.1 hypothetical protein GCM10010112_67500 [Actinoplanes lobatus]GIE43495.1 hypothetical protein Alo02nite_63930 [Actinoplanes lobatus]